jgi:DNA-binding LacI/PurR family transcriptional regulator
MITIKDIAQVAGVSESTVSRVLSKPPEECNVSEPLQRKVREVANKFEYQPNLMARGLATRRTGNIGLVIYQYEHLTSPVMTQVVAGVANAISLSEYSLLIEAIYQPGKQDKESRKLSGLFARRQVDGLIIVAQEVEPIWLLELVREKYPFVLCNTHFPEILADSVRTNSVEFGNSVVRYLAELGHRNIAIFPGPEYVGNRHRRGTVDTIHTAASELGLRIAPENLIYTGYSQEEAYRGAKKLFSWSEPPTAVFAADDAIAIGVLEAAQKQGLHVPEDVSILSGVDTYKTQLASIPITAIQIPYDEIGFESTQLLFKRLKDNKLGDCQQVFLPFIIVERKSCGPVNLAKDVVNK